MSYDEYWTSTVEGLDALLECEKVEHDLDLKMVHAEARRLLDRVGGDLHPARARAVLIAALMQSKREDFDWDPIPGEDDDEDEGDEPCSGPH